MSAPIVLSCLWVVAAASVAMLPMRLQVVPGLALLAAAPVLLAWIWRLHGPVLPLLAALAVVSMYRRPLAWLARRGLARLRADGPQAGHDP